MALKSSNEDLSGGIFFDGSTNFQDSPSSIQPSNQEHKNKMVVRENKPTKQKRNNNNSIPKDVVIIGAGLAGLSTALHISMNSNRQVTIIEKEDPIKQMKKTAAASFAAAGMLAPHSERLPSGPLLDLCLKSRDMYTDFVGTIESITSNCGLDAIKYLWNKESEKTCGLEPWEVGYAATGGFLAPAFAGDSVATWSPPAQVQCTAKWLDEVQIREMEPALHPEVIGGWWFPEDASVDARRLTCALRAACIERGVQFMWGDGSAAGSLELGGGKCKGIRLANGRILEANSVVVANGSWMRNLLPIPVTPHKGQSFSLRMPENTEPLLSRILFAQDTYIVPKADGRIVIGATVETGTFDCDVTPAGMMHCISNALQLVPGLADLPVEESWAGLRPTTPDKGPILGRTSWDNLFIAGGYWRNGVLLAPKTGQLIGDLVINDGATLPDEEDESLITSFNWDRFTATGGGKALAANTRHAASMHPVHTRASGSGVAAAVGTELGFYSGADAAREERKKDRESLFNEGGISGDEEDAFEKAANLGLSDASAFSTFGESIEKPRSKATEMVDVDNEDEMCVSGTQPFDGTPDALTVGYKATDEENESQDTVDTGDDEDSQTYDETSFDGYQTIQKANARQTRDQELEAMKKARIANRIGASQIDQSNIGVFKAESKVEQQANDNSSEDLNDVYKKIRENKEISAAKGIEMATSTVENKPDPGFRVFHVDKETREEREVPPYTSPAEFMSSFESFKKNV
jgi:thiazole synthase